MRDDPETLLRQEEHLAIPGVSVERPAVRKRNSRSSAPVLVVNLPSIFRCDGAHDTLLLGSFITELFQTSLQGGFLPRLASRAVTCQVQPFSRPRRRQP